MSRVLVDTGVFSASLTLRRRERFEKHVRTMSGRSIFLASQTAGSRGDGYTVR
ncbi:MAG: hypothetical protein IT195_00105 [Microthrixaceae bacterium]|nr:hypothetical protein [Microthrixaceae bacterium]